MPCQISGRLTCTGESDPESDLIGAEQSSMLCACHQVHKTSDCEGHTGFIECSIHPTAQ